MNDHRRDCQAPPEVASALSDLDAMKRLLEISTIFVHEGNLESVLDKIVETAMAISGADFGNIQLVDEASSDLRIVAQRGFSKEWLDFWNRVAAGAGACGTALERRERVIIEDVLRSPIFAGTPALEVQLQEGVRAVQSTPLFDRRGQPLGMFSTHYRTPHRPGEHALDLLDLLARQTAGIIERARTEAALRKSEERFRALVTATSDVVYQMSPDWNEMRHLRGRLFIADTETPSRTWLERYIHPEDQPRVLAAISEAIRSGSAFELEHRVLRVDGSLGWTRSRAIPIKDIHGEITEWFGAAGDITARKQADEAKARAAEEANRQKDLFIASLGHELRNPLAPIRTAVAWMSRAAPADPSLRRGCEMIERQVSHMTRLIDDLLDVSRIAHGKITLREERFELTDVVQAAAQEQQPLLASSGVALELALPQAPLRAHGDAARIAQVIGNLLINAIKFTDRDGTVAVELRREGEERALITVRDTGIGMDAETLRSLFSPFAQAQHSRARSRGGLGLGLALVKGIAELHGGSVRAWSAGLGQGSEFQVSLPILLGRETETGEAVAAPNARPRQRPQRVLIVEDNLDAAESLGMFLAFLGHQVAVAHTGEEGLRQAHAQKPETVLCDIGLAGGMDGYAVAQALRADPEVRSAFLIALTGYGQEEDRRRAREAGFDVHLTKPPDPEVLERLLARPALTR